MPEWKMKNPVDFIKRVRKVTADKQHCSLKSISSIYLRLHAATIHSNQATQQTRPYQTNYSKTITNYTQLHQLVYSTSS